MYAQLDKTKKLATHNIGFTSLYHKRDGSKQSLLPPINRMSKPVANALFYTSTTVKELNADFICTATSHMVIGPYFVTSYRVVAVALGAVTGESAVKISPDTDDSFEITYCGSTAKAFRKFVTCYESIIRNASIVVEKHSLKYTMSTSESPLFYPLNQVDMDHVAANDRKLIAYIFNRAQSLWDSFTLEAERATFDVSWTDSISDSTLLLSLPPTSDATLKVTKGTMLHRMMSTIARSWTMSTAESATPTVSAVPMWIEYADKITPAKTTIGDAS